MRAIATSLLLFGLTLPQANAALDQINLFIPPEPKKIQERLIQRTVRAPENIPELALLSRSIDGTGNNKNNLGKVFSQMPRLKDPTYANGRGEMVDRGNPRQLSNLIGAIAPGDLVPLNENGLNMLFVLFGQFLDHDLDLTLPAGNQRAFIKIPKGDPNFDKNNEGNKTIEFTRSKFSMRNNNRVFANEVTSFIDGSQIYGSDMSTMRSLRQFNGGKLKLPNNLLPKGNNGAFLAGDSRVNENVGLTSLQTIFAREHNRQCELLQLKFPILNDEELFQMARNKIIGFIQKITYSQFLPQLLGPEAYNEIIGDYTGYDERVNPTIEIEFSTAAYRIGHTLLADGIDLSDHFNQDLKSIPMKDMFLAFQVLKKPEDVDFTMNGLMRTQCKQKNHQLADGLRNFLTQNPGVTQDLFALNVQRGRDHGLADYNTLRQDLGLQPIKTFSDLTKNKDAVAKLTKAYGQVNNIDLWVGIISEEPLRGGVMGLVGAVIVGQTFKKMRNGDKFWYQSAYPQDAVSQIEETTLRDIILRNTRLSNIPKGFKIPSFDKDIQTCIDPSGKIVRTEANSLSQTNPAASQPQRTNIRQASQTANNIQFFDIPTDQKTSTQPFRDAFSKMNL